MANYCKNCGSKLPFLQRHSEDALCNACRDSLMQAQQARFAALEQSLATARTATAEQLALLKSYDHRAVLDLYFRLYNRLVADRELDAQDVDVLHAVRLAGGLTSDETRFDELIRPYVYVNAIRTEGALPTVNFKVEGASPLILHKGEVVHYGHEATLNEIRTVSLGYQGGSHGFSIPIYKGVRYRVGASRGHVVKQDRLLQTSAGALVVTNQRIFLHPAPGNKPVSIPLNNVLSYNCFDNGVELYKEGREKGYFFSIKGSGAVEVFCLCLGFLLGGGYT